MSDKIICSICGTNGAECVIMAGGETEWLGWQKIHGEDYCPECVKELGITGRDMTHENIFEGFEM